MAVGKVPPMDAEGHAFFIDQDAKGAHTPRPILAGSEQGLKGLAREAATRSRAACGQVPDFGEAP
jgi:hypothetical protein